MNDSTIGIYLFAYLIALVISIFFTRWLFKINEFMTHMEEINDKMNKIGKIQERMLKSILENEKKE